MLRAKERKIAKLNRGRWRFIYVLKIDCKGKRTIGKVNKGINVKKNNRFKKLKLKKEKKKKKRKTPQNCKSPTNKEAEVYDNNKNVTEEKKSSKA